MYQWILDNLPMATNNIFVRKKEEKKDKHLKFLCFL